MFFIKMEKTCFYVFFYLQINVFNICGRNDCPPDVATLSQFLSLKIGVRDHL